MSEALFDGTIAGGHVNISSEVHVIRNALSNGFHFMRL